MARHSVTLGADASYRGWCLRLNWVSRSGRRDASGTLPAWNTLDLTAQKSFCIKGFGELALNIGAKNLTDFRYEAVRGYPMPERSFIGGVEFRF